MVSTIDFWAHAKLQTLTGCITLPKENDPWKMLCTAKASYPHKSPTIPYYIRISVFLDTFTRTGT